MVGRPAKSPALKRAQGNPGKRKLAVPTSTPDADLMICPAAAQSDVPAGSPVRASPLTLCPLLAKSRHKVNEPELRNLPELGLRIANYRVRLGLLVRECRFLLLSSMFGEVSGHS